MPQLRQNPITGQWVILAENRGGRPQEVDVQQIVRPQSICPFCEGNESRTPDEVFAIRAAGSKVNGPGWRVRVVPNKYPALEARDISPSPQPSPARGEEVFQGHRSVLEVFSGAGLHEIVIESPRHLKSITELNDVEVAEVFDAYRQRLLALRQSKQYRSAIVFKNGGPAAGATLVHLHSQVMAFQAGAPVIDDRLGRFQDFTRQHGECPLCQMLNQAGDDEQTVVAATKNFVAFCPVASRFAYEMWIAPRQHTAHFDSTTAESLRELGSLMRSVLVKLEAIVKLPVYNYIVQTAPFDTSGSDHYHWHIEILPRTTSLAGFELGTGCYINTVSSERAATALREA
jgi:UDPglucose--hexose-1-phosphate uridylyltransferase